MAGFNRSVGLKLIEIKFWIVGLLFVAACTCSRYIEDPESFPGWKGELPDVITRALPSKNITLNSKAIQATGWGGVVEILNWQPRAFLLKDFLTDEECHHLITKAKERLEDSIVVDNDTGKGIATAARTSKGMFFAPHEDPVIQSIEERIALVTHIPESHGEGMQVLQYSAGQQYEAHHDFFFDKVNSAPEAGGQRVATILMYLSSVEEGGETMFPKGLPKAQGPGWSECAQQGFSVKAVKRNALLFYDMDNDGQLDFSSLHAGCPPIKGVKWSATKWLHQNPFATTAALVSSDWRACVDGDDRCETWASRGECDKNTGFMHTVCRKACGTCVSRTAPTTSESESTTSK
eukprot:jgi/Botrbrau1/22745/Bobra.0132s0078.1